MKRPDDPGASDRSSKPMIDVDEFRAVFYCISKDSDFFFDRPVKFSALFPAAACGDDGYREAVPTRGDGFSWIVQVIQADFDAVRSTQVRGKDFIQTPWSE